MQEVALWGRDNYVCVKIFNSINFLITINSLTHSYDSPSYYRPDGNLYKNVTKLQRRLQHIRHTTTNQQILVKQYLVIYIADQALMTLQAK